jgi:hypothetical protein
MAGLVDSLVEVATEGSRYISAPERDWAVNYETAHRGRRMIRQPRASMDGYTATGGWAVGYCSLQHGRVASGTQRNM